MTPEDRNALVQFAIRCDDGREKLTVVHPSTLGPSIRSVLMEVDRLREALKLILVLQKCGHEDHMSSGKNYSSKFSTIGTVAADALNPVVMKGSPEDCERCAKELADRRDPTLWGAVGALNWAAKRIRDSAPQPAVD